MYCLSIKKLIGLAGDDTLRKVNDMRLAGKLNISNLDFVRTLSSEN
jgi:hypothetical protein